LRALSWRPRNNLDAAFQRVLSILQEHEFSLTAIEELGEHAFKVCVRLRKGRLEEFTRLGVNHADELDDLLFGFQKIVFLCAKEGVTLFQLLVLLDSHEVHGAERLNFGTEFCRACFNRRDRGRVALPCRIRLRNKFVKGKTIFIVNMIELVLTLHAGFRDIDLSLVLIVAKGVKGAATLREDCFVLFQISLVPGTFAARGLDLLIEGLSFQLHGFKIGFERLVLLVQTGNAFIVGHHTPRAALDGAVQFVNTGLAGIGLGGGVFELLRDARHLDAAFCQMLRDVSVRDLQLMQTSGLVRCLFDELIANGSDLFQFSR